MTLTDAGPLFALLDQRQTQAHHRCKSILTILTTPLVTTWPSFTEAMYLAGRSGGWPMQAVLRQYVRDGALALYDGSDPEEIVRIENLMERYKDAPMDLADASLVVAAESLGFSRIFTLDHHFRVYQLYGSKPFDVIP